MHFPTLSVIVPVYNKEKYLSESLDSLINQTFIDSEIIVINDGSTDKSLDIIKEYQAKYDRIKVINQENQGASVARNKGIEAATGKYVIMFDGDDLAEKDAHRKMVATAEELGVDVVCCNYAVTSGSNYSPVEYDYPCDVYLNREYIENVVIPHSLCQPKSKKFVNAHCTLLIKRTLLTENNVRYNELHRKEEDKPFLMHVIRYAQSMAFVKEKLLIYRKLGDTLINQYSPRFENIMRNFDLYKELYADIFDFNSTEWLDFFVSVFEECIGFVIIHKRNVKSVKKEIMKIITHKESLETLPKIGDKHETLRRLYQKNDMKGVYKYYMKKLFKLRVKITIRDIIRR